MAACVCSWAQQGGAGAKGVVRGEWAAKGEGTWWRRRGECRGMRARKGCAAACRATRWNPEQWHTPGPRGDGVKAYFVDTANRFRQSIAVGKVEGGRLPHILRLRQRKKARGTGRQARVVRARERVAGPAKLLRRRCLGRLYPPALPTACAEVAGTPPRPPAVGAGRVCPQGVRGARREGGRARAGEPFREQPARILPNPPAAQTTPRRQTRPARCATGAAAGPAAQAAPSARHAGDGRPQPRLARRPRTRPGPAAA